MGNPRSCFNRKGLGSSALTGSGYGLRPGVKVAGIEECMKNLEAYA